MIGDGPFSLIAADLGYSSLANILVTLRTGEG